jgi:hypothetical protein
MSPVSAAWALAIAASPLLTYFLMGHRKSVALAIAAGAFTYILVRAPQTATVLLVPVSLFSSAFAAPLTVVIIVAGVTLFVGFQVLAGAVPLRAAHLWIGLLACLLAVSYLSPSVTAPVPDVTRLSDLMGILAGLALLAAATASPPDPAILARVIALVGGLAAGYTLLCGDYANGRLEGLGFNPNFLGAMLALPLVAAAGLVKQGRRLGWMFSAAVCFAAVASTQSRGAFFAVAAGLVAVVFQGCSLKRRILAASVAAIVIIVAPSTISLVEQAVTGGRESSELSYDSHIRGQVAQFAAGIIVHHPLRGIGFGMFPGYAAGAPNFGIYMATHDDYLRLAAEGGLFTLGAFVILLGLGVRAQRPGHLATLKAITFCYAVSLLFANSLANMVVSAPFWLSLGCLLGTPTTSGLRRRILFGASPHVKSFRHEESR